MTGTIEFTNTHSDERALTLQFLEDHGAYDIVEGTDEEGNLHFTFSFAVDSKCDILNLLAITLFYNDVAPDDLKTDNKILAAARRLI